MSVLCLIVAACGPAGAPAPSGGKATIAAPPPLPAGASTADFEADRKASEASASPADTYWGLKPGEALPIGWADLMPEGAEEALEQEQARFYAMLEKQYAANATMLSDAKPLDQIQEGSSLDYMPQLGTFDVVHDLDGRRVRIPGYVVPFDFNEKKRQGEFLFVPYMGACIHTPPPPPNQIIFVRADPAIRLGDIWAPYWLQGTLTAEQTHSDTGDAAYALTLETLEPYDQP